MDNFNKMTDERLNIAIAEELGWIKVESVKDMQIDLICQETYFSINKSGWLDAMGKDWDYHYNIFSPATSIGHAWVLPDSEKWTWTMHDYDDAIMKQLGVIEVTFDITHKTIKEILNTSPLDTSTIYSALQQLIKQ